VSHSHNRRKVCTKGHPLTEGNIYRAGTLKSRLCIICRDERRRISKLEVLDAASGMRPFSPSRKLKREPEPDLGALQSLIRHIANYLGCGDYIHSTGRANLPRASLPARARADDDPYLKLRAAILFEALEKFADDPNDAELRSFFFSGRYWNCFRVAQFESPDDGDGVESPLKYLRESYSLWFEDEGDGPLSLENLCYPLGLNLRTVRMRLAQALGGKDLRHRIAFATAGERSRKATAHNPQPMPWHKVEADKYAAVDRNIHNPWSIHFEKPFEPPAIWAEIFAQVRLSFAEEKAAIARKRSAEWYERVGRALRRSRRAAA